VRVLAALKYARIWDEHRKYDGTDCDRAPGHHRKFQLFGRSAHVRTDPAQIVGMQFRSKSQCLAPRPPTSDSLSLVGRLLGERFDMQFLQLPEAFPAEPTTGLRTGLY
jgi:hypothetical protein